MRNDMKALVKAKPEFHKKTFLKDFHRSDRGDKLADAEFCDRWVDGLGDLHRAVRAFDLGHVERRCGVPADDVVRAARMFASARRGSATTSRLPAPRTSSSTIVVSSARSRRTSSRRSSTRRSRSSRTRRARSRPRLGTTTS